jgi:hypothetical protein
MQMLSFFLTTAPKTLSGRTSFTPSVFSVAVLHVFEPLSLVKIAVRIFIDAVALSLPHEIVSYVFTIVLKPFLMPFSMNAILYVLPFVYTFLFRIYKSASAA